MAPVTRAALLRLEPKLVESGFLKPRETRQVLTDTERLELRRKQALECFRRLRARKATIYKQAVEQLSAGKPLITVDARELLAVKHGRPRIYPTLAAQREAYKQRDAVRLSEIREAYQRACQETARSNIWSDYLAQDKNKAAPQPAPPAFIPLPLRPK